MVKIKLLEPLRRDGTKPVHLIIRERILGMIQSNEIWPGDRLPGESDIAEALQVSRMTVNKAILSLVSDGWLERTKGKGTYVTGSDKSTKLRAAVAIAEEVSGAMDNYYFGSLFFGLVQQGESQGIQLELVSLKRMLAEPKEFERFDSLILINPPVEALSELNINGIGSHDVIVLGATWRGSGLSCIDSDNISGTALAVSHLAQLGHRNLMFVGACPGDANSIDRLRGFEIATRMMGILNPCIAPWSPLAIELSSEAQDFILTTLTQENRPTAIVAAGSVIAMHVNRLIGEAGLSVPGDVSLIAYDDPAFLAATSPPITTIVQPFAEMVEIALSELIRLRKNPLSRPQTHIRHSELVERSSTAVPRPNLK